MTYPVAEALLKSDGSCPRQILGSEAPSALDWLGYGPKNWMWLEGSTYLTFFIFCFPNIRAWIHSSANQQQSNRIHESLTKAKCFT